MQQFKRHFQSQFVLVSNEYQRKSVGLGWRNGYGTALLDGRSRDRSPVVLLGIFSVASDNSMCPGSTQPLKMSNRILLGVKTAGAYG
jgi:hypothetical protein